MRDITLLASMYAQGFQQLWSAAAIELFRTARKPNTCIWKLFDRKHIIVAMASTTTEGACIWIGDVLVKPTCRNQGIGEQLLRQLIGTLQHRYLAKPIALCVLAWNKPALALYRKVGFKLHDETSYMPPNSGENRRLFYADYIVDKC